MTTTITEARRRALADDRDIILAMYPHKIEDPMPEALHQEPHLVEILSTLRIRFGGRPDVLVSGDTFVYYVEGDPRYKVSPDCYVAFGVDEAEVRKDESYITWRAGKVPDFALEIGSKSTARRDQVGKRELYARMGIAEYWLFDPTGNRHYDYPLDGYRLVDGVYEPIDMKISAAGIRWGHSEVLELDLCWERGHLRFYDPVAGDYLLDHARSEAARKTAESRVETERAARKAAESRVETERAARKAAEAEIERLRNQLRSGGG